jgi:hypothetical protein
LADSFSIFYPFYTGPIHTPPKSSQESSREALLQSKQIMPAIGRPIVKRVSQGRNKAIIKHIRLAFMKQLLMTIIAHPALKINWLGQLD